MTASGSADADWVYCCLFCLIFFWRGRINFAPFVRPHRLVGPFSSALHSLLAVLILDGGWMLLLMNLVVACFHFAGGKRTFPNGMPFVQSSSSYLAPRLLVIVDGKRTFPNGMPTFLSIDVPQRSRGFDSCFSLAHGHEMSSLRIQFSCLLEGRWKYW